MTNIKDLLFKFEYRSTEAKLDKETTDVQMVKILEDNRKEAKAQLQKAFEEAVEEIIGEEPREDVVDFNGIGYSPERFALLTNYKNQRTKAKQVIKEMF